MLNGEWQSLVDHALSDREREVLIGLATHGVPAPQHGFESDDGMPYPLAWPSAKYALGDHDSHDLDGWTVRRLDSADVEQIVRDLHQLVAG